MTALGDFMASFGSAGWAGGEAPGSALDGVDAFGANPGSLKMWRHLPQALVPGAPLIVVLHGCGQSAAAYAQGAGWIAFADRFGCALLCPEQTRTGNANLCFNWFQPGDVARGQGEVASIRAMVEHALVTHALDRSRVFVTGLSAGGAMATALLAAYPEVFAAGAIVAGLPYGAASTMQEAFSAMYVGQNLPARTWGDRVRKASHHAGAWPRVSIWQGEADSTVRPVVADEIVRQWTDLHGLAEAAAETQTRQGRAVQVWRSASGEPVVELNRIAGMGHGAPIRAAGPDGYGAPAPYCLETGISSTLEIARFWGLAEAPARATAPVRSAPTFPAPPKIAIATVIESALKTARLLK